LLTAQYEGELLERAMSGELFEAFGSDWQGYYIINNGHAPPLAGHIRLTSNSKSGKPESHSYRIPNGDCEFRSMRSRYSREDDISAVFLPDPEVAFDVGFDEYFNGIVEWHHVDLAQLPDLGVPDVVRPNDTPKPSTRVAAIED
jgi:hypothetical protein